MNAPAATPVRVSVLVLALLALWATGGALAQDEADNSPRRDRNPADEHLLMAEIALERGEIAVATREATLAAEKSGSSATAERATQLSFATGFDGYALRSARRWVELVPDSPVANEVLGRLQLRRHRVDDAAESFARALGSPEPQRDEIYLALAADLADEKDADLVTRVLSRLTAWDPLAPGLQLALGQAALRSRDYDLAAASAAAASLDDPAWREPRLLAVRILADRGDTDAALAQLSALADTNDEGGVDVALELERARMLADAGRGAEARAVLADPALNTEEALNVQRTSAFLALKEDDGVAAEREFAALSQRDETRSEAYYYLGQLAAVRGDAATARGFLRQVGPGPYQVPAQMALAESRTRDNELDAALEDLRSFSRLNPLNAFDLLEYQAQLLAGAERFEEALAVYEEALVYKPEDPDLLLSRGTLLEQMGKIDAALKDMERAADIAPDDASIVNAYGYTLANRTRRVKEAYPLIRRALELEPASGAIQDSMGWVLFRLGRREEARSHLEEAFQRIADPEVASHLAEVHWTMGDRDQATDLLRAALVAFPRSEPALQTSRRLLR